MRRNRVASRGELWLVDLGMVQKARPALILNRAFKDSDRALISVIAHTTSVRGSDLEIPIPLPFLKPGAFVVQNPVTVPAIKAERFLGRLTAQQLAQVEAGVRDWLGL
jgi:mRNA interferase MazF